MKTGWSLDNPTVFIDGERDRITAQSGKIEYDIIFNSLKKGLVPFISQYGNLYHGKFSPQYFISVFNYNRKNFLKNLGNALNLTNWDEYSLFSSAFYMYMCRVCQKESWIWPALCSRMSDSDIKQTSGISRIVATGICKPHPWNEYRVLFLEKKDKNPQNILNEFELISSDQQLHQVLNLRFESSFFQVTEAKIGIDVDHNNDAVLSYINNKTFHETVTEETKTIWNDLVVWIKKYSSRPKIKIYTDWPELVTNQHDFWNLEIAGPSEPIYKSMFKPGHIERSIRDLHNSQPDNNCHVMHIIKPRPINITELLCWLNLRHTTYIDTDYEFIVYRPDKDYSTTFINLSTIPV